MIALFDKLKIKFPVRQKVPQYSRIYRVDLLLIISMISQGESVSSIQKVTRASLHEIELAIQKGLAEGYLTEESITYLVNQVELIKFMIIILAIGAGIGAAILVGYGVYYVYKKNSKKTPPEDVGGGVPVSSTTPKATQGYPSSQKNIVKITFVLSLGFKYLITVYASWILFVRSFFLKETPYFIPIMALLAHANLYVKVLPQYGITSITFLFLWMGVYLIAIDSLGSLISSYALSGTTNLFDQVIPFLTKERSSMIEIFYKSAGYSAILIGKTAMTATGRASLIIGGGTGIGYLINAHLERRHKSFENEKTREATSREAQKQRDWASKEAQKQRDWQDYNSSWNPFKKPPTKP